MSATYVVKPQPFHPTYDAQWITWRGRGGQVWAVPMHAPRRIVAAATLKPGAVTVSERPDGAEVWHPHLEV